MKKVVCVHLLNDYSGSPLVLAEAIRGMLNEGMEVELYTSLTTKGFLNDIPGVIYHDVYYRWSKLKLLTLLYLMISQTFLFFRLWRFWKQDIIVYVNTILPFGAGLSGKLMGKEVIYHVHETSVKPLLLKMFLVSVIRCAASRIIYVSEYLRRVEGLQGKTLMTIYNALPEDFRLKASSFQKEVSESRNILMLCSLKSYKGVREFCMLAAMLPDYSFTLVLNSDPLSIHNYFKEMTVTDNLRIHSSQKDVHSFYEKADLVLNLSHTDQWIETFGMTVLEAMSYGIPVIIPTVGGITELVIDGFNGFKISVQSLDMIKEQIKIIFENKSFYNYLSSNARTKSGDYTLHRFTSEVCAAVQL